MFKYFSNIRVDNDLSITAHATIACFLAAAHETMLKWLKEIHENEPNAQQVLRTWHELMEKKGGERQKFFTCVVGLAEEASNRFLVFCPLPKSFFSVQIAAKVDGRDESKTRGWEARQAKL